MGKRIVEMLDEENNIIYIETEISQSSLELVADNDNEIIKALTKFENSLDPVVNLSKSVINRIKELNIDKPSDLELSFTIKLSAKLDFWVISGNGEGNIALKLKWSLG